MHKLLIDIGNSAIKVAFGNKNLSKVKSFPYKKNNFKKEFIEIIRSEKSKGTISKIGVSLLDETKKDLIKNILLKQFKIQPVFINSKIISKIKFDYDKSLGSDRICSAVAASELFKSKNILVVDFGTATTYNLIIKGVFKGGLITPGIKTSLASLTEKTTLPDIDLKKGVTLFTGKTKDNIRSGVLLSSIFTYEMFTSLIKDKFKNLAIIATGGNVVYFPESLISNKFIHVPNLVLKGINIILNSN